MSLSIRILFAVILIPLFNFSQEAEVNPPDYIKTIIFKGSNTQESQLPVLRLGEYISLEFDALNGEEDNYYYKIEHYNFDWTPSPLARAEFMVGFDNQRIRNYENSFNTFQIYSHYKLSIPNDRTRSLKVSGNYMLKVFNDYDELVFSRKFMVYENGASVGVNIKRSRNVKFIEGKQSVDIVVNATGIRFNNPLQNVKTVIIQNNNLNTAITDLKPQYTIGNELIYKYTNESSFWAGNEYLFFENKDIRAANTGIQSIELKDLYHNYLFTNTVRANKPYTYNPDINGNFLITAIDADNPDIEADYAWIHFSLLAPKMTDGKSIYVYGNFNNYALEDSNKMTYDDASGAYFTELLLKQGFYSYKYVVVDKNNNIDEGAIGGNFYQTENNYKVLVYYRELGARYDKLIGIGEASSVDISN
ncbi:type IX secretion system plug protein domain-containing protein [Corallibacter sp.]|uniref:type IX secretion system plug protein n=1 Tax=Corallibacter sp. TaxID=2038084 RepID=UPI003AB519F7